MQTCVIRPALSSKLDHLDLTEFTKLSEALPGVNIIFESIINLKKVYPGTFLA